MNRKADFNPTDTGLHKLYEDICNTEIPDSNNLDKEISEEINKTTDKMDVSLIDENVSMWYEINNIQLPKSVAKTKLNKHGTKKYKKTIYKAIIIAAIISVLCITGLCSANKIQDLFNGVFELSEDKVVYKPGNEYDIEDELTKIKADLISNKIDNILLPYYSQGIKKVLLRDVTEVEGQTDISIMYEYDKNYITVIASSFISKDVLPELSVNGQYEFSEIIESNNIKFYVISTNKKTSVFFTHNLIMYQIYTDFDIKMTKDIINTIS